MEWSRMKYEIPENTSVIIDGSHINNNGCAGIGNADVGNTAYDEGIIHR